MTDYLERFENSWDDFGRLFENDFEDMNRKLDSMFDELTNTPGVQTYGYTMYQGPDGVPHVREFGNTAQNHGLLAGSPAQKYVEPNAEVQQNGDVVEATFEMPGVPKEDVDLEATQNTLTVSVDTPTRKFSKTVTLPCDVDMGSAEATYNNGVLDVKMRTVKYADAKTKIAIA